MHTGEVSGPRTVPKQHPVAIFQLIVSALMPCLSFRLSA